MVSDREAAFIARQDVARLASADLRGRPHVIPICFVYLNGCFYTAIDDKPKRSRSLRRLRNIDANAHVALVLDEYSHDWSRLAWVLVEGRAEVLSSGDEHASAIQALRGKYAQYQAMRLETSPLIKVTPERVLSWGNL